ncbi:glutamate-gated chloride channel alpha-like [Amphibalanus amphitrite]|uniref:glutamate-gated chloride channel alpha-like n=1 Tax=Amphibalanus amphitrite TaxID=1232801 RepID=UPI001C9239AD|nr:glutamate-gated chloride channel alpha-like [Amphibalanus amphitrite]XP_043221274.1 glutamate-gated chloride channel alpha-like [Amphibalanus amphitrite]
MGTEHSSQRVRPGRHRYGAYEGSCHPCWGLSFEVLLSRRVSNAVLTMYVPSTMLLIVSWLSLWVPPELVPGRMVLVITTLLTLTALFNASIQAVPEINYVKALDIWNLACIVFVFCTIVEYIAVLRFSNEDKRRKVVPVENDKKAAWSVCRRWSGEEKADLLERTFRALLPAAFCVFNIAYWSYFLTTNDA